MVCAGGVDSVLIGDNLPELGPDLRRRTVSEAQEGYL